LSKIIVSDTGPLIALALTELLPKLNQLFEAVYVPEVVYAEATIDLKKPGAQSIQQLAKNSWFKVKKVTLHGEFEILADLLGPGEAAAIALAKHQKLLLLIDERKGRRVAQNHDIAVIGTAAVLIKAKENKLVLAVKPLLEKLILHGYRFSANLVIDILERCNENN
jgi:predicted nucleic acid-binding protein